MNETTLARPRAYVHALAMMNGRRTRKLATETRATLHDDGRVTINYRGTDVVTFTLDGSVILDNGGWPTMTTKRRMDSALAPLGMSVLGYVLRHGDVPKSADRNPWRVVTMNDDYSRETVTDFQDVGESGVYVATPWSNYFDVSPATGAPGWGSNYGTAPRLVATITPAMVDSAPWTLDSTRETMTAAGSYWFSPDTLDYFGTRFGDTYGHRSYQWPLAQTPTGALFVTSEYLGFDRDEDRRGYSVRRFDSVAREITTVGDFNHYSTSDSALIAMRHAARLDYAYTIDVCTDCYMAHNGALEDCEPTDSEPLSLIPTDSDVTDGCLVCEPCGHDDCANGPVCGCGYGDPGHGFSWSRCDGCGSSLGGNRDPLVIWPRR
jgi:hypothetical protein